MNNNKRILGENINMFCKSYAIDKKCVQFNRGNILFCSINYIGKIDQRSYYDSVRYAYGTVRSVAKHSIHAT